jgi:lysosomal acid phosphatase
VKTSPEMKRYNEEHADLYRYLSEQSGKNIHDPKNVQNLYSTLFIEELNNLTLPNWTNAVYPEIKSVSRYSFTIPAKTKLLQRLKIGKLL